MKRLLAIGLLALGCTKTGGVPSAVGVAAELVEGGCAAPDDSGALVSAVTQEHALGDAEPPWSACLWKGGTLAVCGVPCEAGSQPHE